MRAHEHLRVDMNMLAPEESLTGYLMVGADGGSDYHPFHVAFQKLPVVLGAGHPGIHGLNLTQPFRADVRYHLELSPGKLVEVPGVLWSPVAVTDNTYPDHSSLCLLSPITRAGTPTATA